MPRHVLVQRFVAAIVGARRARRSTLRRVALTAAACGALATPARANGRYPAAQHLMFDPNDAKHFVATTTIGLLETRDAGRTFLWRCESALGTSGDQDELVAVTASGATVAALSNGLLTTSDGCSFHSAPELAGKYVADIALSRGKPHELYAFYVDVGLDGKVAAPVFHSADDGQSWAMVGAPLPSGMVPLTIDVAPSDPKRIYISAHLGVADQYASVLLRSDDGGSTFTNFPIPGTMDQRYAYIAAVHPTNADRVFVRVDDSPGTQLYASDDGGHTFQKVTTGKGQLLGFAMSPDGAQVAFGGPADGISIGAENATTFDHRSDMGVTCLAWTSDALYACADQAAAPFSIGRSHDMAATFESLVRFDALCGATGCAAASDPAIACAMDWQAVAPSLGATCLMPPDAGSASDAAAGQGSADAHPTDSGGVVSPPPPPPNQPGGCGIARSRDARGVWSAFLITVFVLKRRASARRRTKIV